MGTVKNWPLLLRDSRWPPNSPGAVPGVSGRTASCRTRPPASRPSASPSYTSDSQVPHTTPPAIRGVSRERPAGALQLRPHDRSRASRAPTPQTRLVHDGRLLGHPGPKSRRLVGGGPKEYSDSMASGTRPLNILVTAGPTHEPWDDVRYLGEPGERPARVRDRAGRPEAGARGHAGLGSDGSPRSARGPNRPRHDRPRDARGVRRRAFDGMRRRHHGRGRRGLAAGDESHAESSRRAARTPVDPPRKKPGHPGPSG